MSKKAKQHSQSVSPQMLPGFGGSASEQLQALIEGVALRFNREYQGQPFDLPEEVEAMPIFRERVSGTLQARITSPFWKVVKPQKGEVCLDLGCGVSFLIYPWREWNAFFYGQDISTVARDALASRGPQLNSKLFKGVQLGPAHQLSYEANQFDYVVATGFSCYYPLDYWKAVMIAVKRVLKPEGKFVFDLLNPNTPLAEDWAILETYLGAEVYLEELSAWESIIESTGAKILSRRAGELFQVYQVQF
ncbi:MAG: class I SAM-dependent methyltransferase [Microcoleaceae cyanobacterium]